MSTLIATQGWNYSGWVGPFYPRGTQPADFLSIYARAFRGVEVDSTFYATPDAQTVRGWTARTPRDFTFALKMPQEITHERRLAGADEVLNEFLDRARELGPKLGPILMQMGPDFAPNELPALERFLPRLPRDVRFAVEVRQREWTATNALPKLLTLLTEQNVALALSDGRWIPRETMMALADRPTADFHYVRWMGPDRSITHFDRVLIDRSAEIRSWAEVLKRVAHTRDVYGFFNNHFAGHSPANAREMQELLGQRVVDPARLSAQGSLF